MYFVIHVYILAWWVWMLRKIKSCVGLEMELNC
jgi:hypothetical protein